MRTALLIATYNWPEALELVLRSLLRQSQMPHEILIADDGSGEQTRDVIERYRERLSVPLQHIWHEDKGFRKAAILNKAIARATSEYIIQVDGDCFLHPDFIKDHLKEAEEGMYLYGTRVRIKESRVPEVLDKGILDVNFFSSGLKKRPRSIRVPFVSRYFSPQATISKKFRGCNTSFFRKDCIAVNGYNEALEGWGREDSELMIRMHYSGLLGKRLKFKAIVYHLDHHEKPKDQLENNDRIEQTTIAQKRKWCEKGIDQYL